MCEMLRLTESQKNEVTAICRKYGVVQLELFGSATDERFDPLTSDVDVLVTFAPDSNLGPWLEKFFEVKAALEPVFGFRVDLLESAAIKNAHLLEEINRSRSVVYAA